MKPYYVYTQKLCAGLMLKGNKLINIESSKKRKGYNVFIFENNEKLRKDIKELTATKK